MGYRVLPESASISLDSPEYAVYSRLAPSLYRMFRRAGYGRAEKDAVVVEVRSAVHAGADWKSGPLYSGLVGKYRAVCGAEQKARSERRLREKKITLTGPRGGTKRVPLGDFVAAGRGEEWVAAAKKAVQRYRIKRHEAGGIPPTAEAMRGKRNVRYDLVGKDGKTVSVTLRDLVDMYMDRNRGCAATRHQVSSRVFSRIVYSGWKSLEDVVSEHGGGSFELGMARRGRPPKA